MDFEDAKSQLASALRGLDPAGSLGFEGLLRDVLVEVTQASFALAKSGPQHGSDVRSLGVNLFEVALEAKRYGEKTTLQVDALEAKLFASSRSGNGTDLWILAATRAISATDTEKLTLSGEALGITVLILDWPPEPGQLPDLAVLCVEANNAINRNIEGNAHLAEIVDAIRAHPNYNAAAERIRNRLAAPDIGYAAATRAMKQWMLEGLSSDRNAASRLGGKFNNMLAGDRYQISRPKFEKQLDRWFTSGKPAVLLGDEGLGKTWLFLSWAYARIGKQTELPLTLFVPAKEVGPKSLSELIAETLTTRLGHGSVEFWQRRLAQWMKLRPDGPQILLMIDGINQNWQKLDWADLLQPAFDDQWNHRVSVLLSCWPDHWNQLQKLASLTPQATEILVTRFDDSELDALLCAHNLRRENFGSAILELMKVPRLSYLAIARQQDLIASGDITPERLAVEDWKHRIELRGSQLALSDAEFQDFVADLGREVRKQINDTVLTRLNVYERLGRDSGKERADLLSTVAELISGQWLVPTGKTNQFRVNPELVPFALGLDLAHQLKIANEDAAAKAIIAEYIDPFSGQALGVSILRAAVTTALLDSSISRPARQALLTRWVNEQNFSQLDFDAFWRIIGLDVELVLQAVEESWLGEGSRSISTDEIIIKGLANAYQFDAVAPSIDAKITRWLGWFWKDPLQGSVIGGIDATSSNSLKRQTTTNSNFRVWSLFSGRGKFPPIEHCETGNPSWLSHRAIGIISFLPRARFVDAIASWSISRAVMGLPLHFDELAWVIRLNRKDPTATNAEIWSLVDSLVNSEHRLAVDAACWLLKALADPRAEERLQTLRPIAAPSDTQLTSHTSYTNESVLDPTADIDICKIQDVAHAPFIDMDESVTTKLKLLTLARTSPQKLREVISEWAMSAPGLAPSALRQMVNRIGGFLPVLNSDEREVIETAIRATLESLAMESTSSELDWWRARRLELQLVGRTGLAQLELLLNEACNQKLLGNISPKILDITQDDIKSALGRFDSQSDRNTVITWLTILVEFADHRSIDGWLDLPKLLNHADIEITKLAGAVASESNDFKVMETIAESTWTATEVSDRNERLSRSVALLKASQVLKRPELLERADKEISAVWLQREPNDPDALSAYERFFRGAIGDRQRRSRSSVQTLVAHGKAVAILLDRAGDEFWAWLNNTLTSEVKISNLDLISEFPFVVLAEALMTRRPETGLALYDQLKDAMHEGIFKTPALISLPFVAPIDIANATRNSALTNALNDQDIADLVRLAEKHGETAWIANKALELARTLKTDSLATSAMLLGFADESHAIETAWTEIYQLVPRGGWLEDVYRKCRQSYEQNRWARHWYNCYISAKSDCDAIAAHMLMCAAIDIRAVHWIKRKQIAKLAEPRRRFWDLNTGMINTANQNRRTKLKNTLFWTKTVKQTQSPWL